jgi:hypothetical protein
MYDFDQTFAIYLASKNSKGTFLRKTRVAFPGKLTNSHVTGVKATEHDKTEQDMYSESIFSKRSSAVL